MTAIGCVNKKWEKCEENNEDNKRIPQKHEIVNCIWYQGVCKQMQANHPYQMVPVVIMAWDDGMLCYSDL